VTCRREDEGGWFRGDEQERRGLLLSALERGADYVDLEWARGFDDVVRSRHGRNIVLSLHDFSGCPADLEARVDAMAALNPDVLKVAITVSRVAGCGRLAGLARRHAGRRMVLIAMGEAGLATRILPGRFGSCWTYAGDGVAPGQIDIARLLGEFRFRRIGPHTELYGIAGRPVAHSLSPAMHNAAFEQLGLDAAYVPIAAADIDDLFEGVRVLGVAGLSVTAPFKVGVMTGLVSLDPDARETGAVNTLVRDGGGWRGHNTDLEGFLAGCAGLSLDGQRLAVLGTGGAARAVALAARRSGAAVICYGRDLAKAEALSAAVGVGAGLRPVPPGSWDVLVNATPIGTHPDTAQSPFPESDYGGGVAYDLVYNPPRTRFLRDASACGCRTIGGLEMLVAQARRQIELWTGLRPDPEPMRKAAESTLSRQVE
jgi:3-dehydroquinate dehydratase/shikimate dehydrogenase